MSADCLTGTQDTGRASPWRRAPPAPLTTTLETALPGAGAVSAIKVAKKKQMTSQCLITKALPLAAAALSRCRRADPSSAFPPMAAGDLIDAKIGSNRAQRHCARTGRRVPTVGFAGGANDLPSRRAAGCVVVGMVTVIGITCPILHLLSTNKSYRSCRRWARSSADSAGVRCNGSTHCARCCPLAMPLILGNPAAPFTLGSSHQGPSGAGAEGSAALWRHLRPLPAAQAGQARPGGRSALVCSSRCRCRRRVLLPRRCRAGVVGQPALDRLISKPCDGAACRHSGHPSGQPSGEPAQALLSMQLAADLRWSGRARRECGCRASAGWGG